MSANYGYLDTHNDDFVDGRTAGVTLKAQW